MEVAVAWRVGIGATGGKEMRDASHGGAERTVLVPMQHTHYRLARGAIVALDAGDTHRVHQHASQPKGHLQDTRTGGQARRLSCCGCSTLQRAEARQPLLVGSLALPLVAGTVSGHLSR